VAIDLTNGRMTHQQSLPQKKKKYLRVTRSSSKQTKKQKKYTKFIIIIIIIIIYIFNCTFEGTSVSHCKRRLVGWVGVVGVVGCFITNIDSLAK